MTEFFERRIHSAKTLFATPCRFTIRRHYSPLAIRHSLPSRQEFHPPIFSGYATPENLPKFLPAEGGEGDAP
jgi:hypothetical protein